MRMVQDISYQTMMKIAFISYEYPPDTACGGIATYVYQASRLLQKRGHHVEVFTSSPYRCGTEIQDGILIHRVNETDRQEFSKWIGKLFADQHALTQFDVLEAPEYNAEAREAIRLVPDIPLVVKLHTPSFLIAKLSTSELSLLRKARLYIYALRKGVRSNFGWKYDPNNDIERLHTLDADEIVAPSQSLGKKLVEAWGLDAKKISYVPNPYVPSEELLKIPVETHTNIVTFLGRLEIRKGILDIARAIPLILRQYPKAKFRFVGQPLHSPHRNLDMQQYLEHKLRHYSDSLEFTGLIGSERVPDILANTDICVFPSLWENFPNVCLESMAAARGVIGSSAGGMAEMLDDGRRGKLVPPRSPKKIVQAAIELLENPELRIKLGELARERVLNEYNTERIGALQEASYTRAIKQRQAEGARC